MFRDGSSLRRAASYRLSGNSFGFIHNSKSRLITSFIKGRTSHLYLNELLAMVGVSLHTAILTALQSLPDAAMMSKYQKIFQGIAIYFRPIKRRCYRTLRRIFIH